MSDWAACFRRDLPPATPLNDLSESINAVVMAEVRRRAELVESAVLRCAEHGQRVDYIEYHAPQFGLDTHCSLIVDGLDVATVVF